MGTALAAMGTETGTVRPLVIVVDDDAAQLAELQDFVADTGYACHAFTAPGEALAFVAARRRPLILMSDVRMPGMSGIELLGLIRAEAGPPIEVILFSGHAGFNEAVEALKYGIVDFLLKPIDLGRLEKTMRLADERLGERMSEQHRSERLAGWLAEVVTGARAILGPAPPAEPAATPAAPAAPPQRPAEDGALAVLKLTQVNRRTRDRLFGHCRGGDASWEIILFVCEQAMRGQTVSVTAACHAATIPQTTALRKIDELVAAGLLARAPCADDRRCILLHPTDECMTALTAYLEATAQQLERFRAGRR